MEKTIAIPYTINETNVNKMKIRKNKSEERSKNLSGS